MRRKIYSSEYRERKPREEPKNSIQLLELNAPLRNYKDFLSYYQTCEKCRVDHCHDDHVTNINGISPFLVLFSYRQPFSKFQTVSGFTIEPMHTAYGCCLGRLLKMVHCRCKKEGNIRDNNLVAVDVRLTFFTANRLNLTGKFGLLKTALTNISNQANYARCNSSPRRRF